MTPDNPPELRLGNNGPVESQVAEFLRRAQVSFAANDHHAVTDALYQAHALAHHAGLHRQAASLRQAITILASGGKPRILKRIVPADPR